MRIAKVPSRPLLAGLLAATILHTHGAELLQPEQDLSTIMPLMEATVLCPALGEQLVVECPRDGPDPEADAEPLIEPPVQPNAGPETLSTPEPEPPAAPESLDGIGEVQPAPPGAPPPEDFVLLGKSIPMGVRRQLRWTAGETFAGRSLDTPVLVVRGASPGPVLCLTAAIHGDELNGVEIVRRVLKELDPDDLDGTVVGVPIVNLLGFTRGSRYLPDRRDLNRYFPGNSYGSAASRIAHLFFEQVVKKCDRLVDIHTGSLKRANLPQLRADLNNPAVFEFTGHFGGTAVLHNSGAPGTLRRAANDAGVPAVALELGEPHTLQPRHVNFGVRAIETLMHKLGMIDRFRLWSEPQPVYYGSRWVRADAGGILMSHTKLGARVAAGDLIGTVVNPISNEEFEIIAPWTGRILGMALNQFVLPGFAAFHIGTSASEPREDTEDPQAPVLDDPQLEGEPPVFGPNGAEEPEYH